MKIVVDNVHKFGAFGVRWCMVQGAQAVGMGSEAHTIPAAAALYAKANEILG